MIQFEGVPSENIGCIYPDSLCSGNIYVFDLSEKGQPYNVRKYERRDKRGGINGERRERNFKASAIEKQAKMWGVEINGDVHKIDEGSWARLPLYVSSDTDVDNGFFLAVKLKHPHAPRS